VANRQAVVTADSAVSVIAFVARNEVVFIDGSN
jgi:hypothetical protein